MKLSALHNADEELIFALKFSKKTAPRDVYGIGPMTGRTFYEVKELQRLLSHPEGFEKAVLFALEIAKQTDPELFEFFAYFNYCREQIDGITAIENATLSHTPTADEERAGIERFGKFGYLLSINSLAGGDVLKWAQVRELPYEVALSKLMIDKDQSDFDKALFEVQNPRRGA